MQKLNDSILNDEHSNLPRNDTRPLKYQINDWSPLTVQTKFSLMKLNESMKVR